MTHTAPTYSPLITASGVDRFLACPGGASLARVTSPRSSYADAGTAEHAVRLQRGQLPAKVLAWFGGVDPLYEVAMATDMAGDDSVYVGQYLDRGYPTMPSPYWLAGTSDMLQIVGDVLSIGDLKTGRGQARGALPVPADSGQLRSLAWLAVRLRQKRDPAWLPSRIRLMEVS